MERLPSYKGTAVYILWQIMIINSLDVGGLARRGSMGGKGDVCNIFNIKIFLNKK